MSEPEEKTPGGWFKVAPAGASVAAITGTFPLLGAVLSEDVTRCELATTFLVGFGGDDLYDEEELLRLKTVFIELAAKSCPGE